MVLDLAPTRQGGALRGVFDRRQSNVPRCIALMCVVGDFTKPFTESLPTKIMLHSVVA